MFSEIMALISVVFIDLVMSGDNAIAIALPIRDLEEQEKRKALFVGIIFAAMLRLSLAWLGVYLIQYPIIKVIGAVLLLAMIIHLSYGLLKPSNEENISHKAPKSWKNAIIPIVIADISMSLENILAVVSASYSHPYIMIVGIAFAIIITAIAASFLSKILVKYPLLAWCGVVIITFVALNMGYHGLEEMGWLNYSYHF